MTFFYNFAFEREIIWAKRLGTRNANDVIAYVCFIRFRITKFENMQYQKE